RRRNGPRRNRRKPRRAALFICAKAGKLKRRLFMEERTLVLSPSSSSFTRDKVGPIVALRLSSPPRLLGILLILRIVSADAVQDPGASGAPAGLAFGIYAEIQSILQIPLRWA